MRLAISSLLSEVIYNLNKRNGGVIKSNQNNLKGAKAFRYPDANHKVAEPRHNAQSCRWMGERQGKRDI